MEVASAEHRPHLVFLYEAVGATLLIYSILLSGDAVSIGFTLFGSLVLFGAVTGGHFNPAVTLGVYVSEAKWSANLKWLALVILAQFTGGFVAQGLAELTLFENHLGNIPASSVAILCPQDPLNEEWPEEF